MGIRKVSKENKDANENNKTETWDSRGSSVNTESYQRFIFHVLL